MQVVCLFYKWKGEESHFEDHCIETMVFESHGFVSEEAA